MGYWKFAIGLMVLCAILTLITDYIISATFTTIFTVPAYIGLFQNNFIGSSILCVGTFVMV